MVCARCGHANQPEARFCSSCGAPLDAASDESTLTLLAVEAAGDEDELAAYLEGLPPGVGLLVVRHGPSAGSSFRLEGEHTNIGRHPDSEIFLDDITVSRRHVVLDRTDKGYLLRDVGSLNGTYVNHDRADEAILRHGDEVQVGRYRLSFVLGADTREAYVNAAAQHVSIGDVLDQLRPEFADITISKIRFLESQGLIDPERTPSGYRKFSAADVDRLRFILREQREHFLPLKVIKERLDEVDRGASLESVSGAGDTPDQGALDGIEPAPKRRRAKAVSAEPLFETARRAAEADEARATTASVQDTETPDDHRHSQTEVILTRAELARAAGISDEELGQLEEYGLVTPTLTSRDRVLFDDDALVIARVAAQFMRHGVEARHLRMYRAFAEREAGLFEQVLLPYRRQRNPEAQARTQATLGELSGLGRQLRTALLRQAVRRSFTG